MPLGNEPDPPEVSPLEQMGALASLLVHDLANHLCIISGNATYAELILNDPDRVANAIHAIVQASEQAGNILGKCGEMRHLLARSIHAEDAQEVAEHLRIRFGSSTDWRVETAVNLSGTCVVEGRWISLIVDRMIAEVAAPRGSLHLQNALLSGGDKPRPCLCIRLRLESAKPLSIKDARASYANIGLLAAYELIRGNGGRVDAASRSATEQEVVIWAPLLESAAG